MIIELVNTGSELMLGRVLNTHQQWLCRKLADLGYIVSRQVAVPDTGEAIAAAVGEALSRSDLVITTGGLGPTSDDLTRDRIAAMLGLKLQEDPAIVAHISRFFESRNRPMPASTRVQALVPEGAQVLENPNGTAPGLALEVKPNPFRGGAPSWLVMLPGPPRELRPMFTDAVVPLLHRVLPAEVFVCRTLRAVGIGESVVEERVAGPLDPLVHAGLELGYCARPGQVDVRISAHGAGAQGLVSQAEAIVRERLDKFIYGSADEDIESTIVDLLTRRGETLAVAESCTGGCIAHRITNVPGSSVVFLAGWVTYSNAAKQRFLGVRTETLEAHGAVSEQVAREMAEGARTGIGSNYAISVTGIAGPGGGSEDKPVGTVFIGLVGPFETVVERRFNPFDRETFKQVTAQGALDLLRRKIPT
ncbi:MAG TPA: competence/damage-inducible protein A [Verrucomicrobiae bacterium]|nr:competence/damage-inducible protein A [Verrucomicrobiae bacterium]